MFKRKEWGSGKAPFRHVVTLSHGCLTDLLLVAATYYCSWAGSMVRPAIEPVVVLLAVIVGGLQVKYPPVEGRIDFTHDLQKRQAGGGEEGGEAAEEEDAFPDADADPTTKPAGKPTSLAGEAWVHHHSPPDLLVWFRLRSVCACVRKEGRTDIMVLVPLFVDKKHEAKPCNSRCTPMQKYFWEWKKGWSKGKQQVDPRQTTGFEGESDRPECSQRRSSPPRQSQGTGVYRGSPSDLTLAPNPCRATL
jgi:hypothetical protein